MRITRDTTALITGANGGLGAAMARALSRAGAQLVLSGRRAEALEPLARELSARVVVADLARPGEVERLVEATGPVDIAVLNAAVPATGHILELGPEKIEGILRVNLTAPILTARALAPAMVERRRGQIVLISSVAGLVANPGASLYSASKFGMRGFALGMRGDLSPHGVGVTTLYPGFIREAGMFAKSGVALPPGFGTRSAEDVADAVLRAVRDNPPEIVVAALDQRVGAFLGALAPRLADLASRTPIARRLTARITAGQRAHFAARGEHRSEV